LIFYGRGSGRSEPRRMKLKRCLWRRTIVRLQVHDRGAMRRGPLDRRASSAAGADGAISFCARVRAALMRGTMLRA